MEDPCGGDDRYRRPDVAAGPVWSKPAGAGQADDADRSRLHRDQATGRTLSVCRRHRQQQRLRLCRSVLRRRRVHPAVLERPRTTREARTGRPARAVQRRALHHQPRHRADAGRRHRQGIPLRADLRSGRPRSERAASADRRRRSRRAGSGRRRESAAARSSRTWTGGRGEPVGHDRTKERRAGEDRRALRRRLREDVGRLALQEA